ncbi:zinc finger protein 2-like isoform X1 [Trichoplusia ni]|uniref:Zinc finger protein 2-like isoform X1 n=1 Tax=Trichoplusia ni TaxID=7111 RepID=A0A7E5X453_TRINI|nr:zinc finger protein 2-like isoform X1 [Trichoplusia ni]
MNYNNMDDCPELVIKKLCCTCLCRDRKLFQLCRINDGINNLYSLLSYDSEAYREGFFKDTASLYICWECRAIMSKIGRFRQQACVAQRQLTMIADGRTDIKTRCLSHLTYHRPNQIITIDSNTTIDNQNFIDCGKSIKSESEEDIPLSELTQANSIEIERRRFSREEKIELAEEVAENRIEAEKRILKDEKLEEDCFSTVLIDESEMEDVRGRRRMEKEFFLAEFKCESCVIIFLSEDELFKHCEVHLEKPNYTKCDICLSYISDSQYEVHRESHLKKYICKYCLYEAYEIKDMMIHLSKGHAVKNPNGKRKKGRRKAERILKSEIKNGTTNLTEKRTSFGYGCTECDKCFENKNQRWKHIQIHHREGYKCPTCGKRFAFKNHLSRHEQLHQGPFPREECPVCHKMIRVDLLKIHSRIHSDRQTFSCIECDKCFVSRASYEHHLKYTQAHAQSDLLKYKCTMCDKGYRSRGELRDHTNYQHMGKTQHKCPVCGKALATRRCITRHVRRAHDGVKESARDKICQQCGKAFRDKKSLREHELIHTGERPLSCEVCGCTFRQRASLYTHRKRVHKIYPDTKRVTLLTDT